MQEIWKDIKGFEGLYQVSNTGKVKSLERINPQNKHQNERLLKPKTNRNGYYEVTLSKGGKLKSFRVNRLVAFAFIENPDPKRLNQVNHKDEIKTNNAYTNLEWCDCKYNINYGTGHARSVANVDCKKRVANTDWERIREKMYKPVVQKSKDGTTVRTHRSAKHAAVELGINQWNIGLCCRGKQKTAGGFKWDFAI
jgi:hypothetical protein